MKLFTAAILAAAVSLSLSAHAATEASVKESVLKAFPQVPLKTVNKLPNGMFELELENRSLAYVSPDGKFLHTGDMLELSTKRNVTRERMAELSKIDFDALPLDKAIKVVKGKGTGKLAVFSDPDCPYCKKIEEELNKLTDATVYMLPFPLPMHPEAKPKSEAVYCAKNPAKAWSDMVLKGAKPTGKCKNPVAEIMAAGRKIGVSGTPTIYFEDGTQASGAMDAAALQSRMNAVSKKK